jgi:hypothetical protein
MLSVPNPTQNDPHDVLEIAPDIVLVARAEQQLSRLARDAAKRSPNPQVRSEPDFSARPSVPPVDTRFRSTVAGNAASRGGARSTTTRLIRGLAGLLLAVLIGVAGYIWQAYGDVAKESVASLLPQSLTTSSAPEGAEAPRQPDQPSQASEAAAPPQQPASAGQTTADSAAPAAPLPDQAQLLQSMARDLASLGQELERLKTSVAELKANQDQMARDIAKASEQSQRLRVSALPPRSVAAAPHRPPPSFRPAQAAAAPIAAPPVGAYVPPPPPPAAAPVNPDVPRPPLPVRE